MNVMKYIPLDISHGISLLDGKELQQKYPNKVEICEGDSPDLYNVIVWLNYFEYKNQKLTLPRAICPLTGISGVADMTYFEENVKKPHNLVSLMSNVELFHTIFQHPVGEKLRALSESEVAFRYVLLKEELKEFSEASTMEAQFDALLDLMYITFGTLVQAGYTGELVEEGFLEVQKSNMTKLDANDKPIFREGDGKIMKGENYREPQLNVLIEQHLNKR